MLTQPTLTCLQLVLRTLRSFSFVLSAKFSTANVRLPGFYSFQTNSLAARFLLCEQLILFGYWSICCRGNTGAETDTSCLLPAHLSHCHRRPLLMEPEVIMEHCQTRGDIFTAFLHQNYLDFSPDLACVTNASAYLSDADFLTSQWTVSQLLFVGSVYGCNNAVKLE